LEEKMNELRKACKVLVAKERRNSVDSKMKFLTKRQVDHNIYYLVI
jgi:hypothetical protein